MFNCLFSTIFKCIEGIPDIQYVASTKAAETKDTHYSGELRDEPGVSSISRYVHTYVYL